jgi:cell division protein FtsB
LVTGKNGLVSYFQLSKKYEGSQTELSQIEKERDKLHKKVSGLYTSSLDLDLLDEQVKRSLGTTNSNEFIYIQQ